MFKLFMLEVKYYFGFFFRYLRRFKKKYFLLNNFLLIFYNFIFCDKFNCLICGIFFIFNRLYIC